VHITGITK